MDLPPDLQTQPEPEHIARAGDLLEAILAGPLDCETRLAVSAALATLYDVFPPYPPPTTPAPTQPLELYTGISLVLEALQAAGHHAASAEEAICVGLAGRELRRLREP
jgi:hypothetical protein